jgi:hypothetical protein
MRIKCAKGTRRAAPAISPQSVEARQWGEWASAFHPVFETRVSPLTVIKDPVVRR